MYIYVYTYMYICIYVYVYIHSVFLCLTITSVFGDCNHDIQRLRHVDTSHIAVDGPLRHYPAATFAQRMLRDL